MSFSHRTGCALAVWLTAAAEVGAQPTVSSPGALDRAVVHGSVGAVADSLLMRYAKYGFAGTVLVARGAEVILLKGYGYADIARRIPNSPTTLFDMASIAKTLTGAAILDLEAAGKLSTSDPVSRFLGPMPPAKSRATIHHLATHMAGLVAEGTTVGDRSRDRFIAKMKNAPPESAPGARYRYSNAGSSLLAAIVELAGGRSYDDHVRQRLLGRAGITSGFRWEQEWATKAAFGYVGRQGGPPGGPPVEAPAARVAQGVWGYKGAGGWVATVGDVLRWYTALHEGDVLPASQRRKLRDSTATEAYGWHYEPRGRRGRGLIHKGGDTPGFQSQLSHYLDEDVIVVWANNDRRRRWRDLLNEGLARVALAESDRWMPPQPVRADSAELARLAGTYVDERGRSLELRSGGTYLYFALGDAMPLEVAYFPTGNGVFTGLPSRGLTPLTLELRTDRSNGSSIAITWSNGATSRSARR